MKKYIILYTKRTTYLGCPFYISFKKIYNFLLKNSDENIYGMIGYKLYNTLSQNGHVARGICNIKDGYLEEVVERIKIVKKGELALMVRL